MPTVSLKNYLTLPVGSYSLGNGLLLRVNAKKRYWIFRYQINGRRRDFSIGSAELFSPNDAKALAMKLRLRVRDGIDPLEEYSNTLEEEKEEINCPTFREIYEPAIEHIASVKRWKNAKHAQQWFNTIADYAVPVIGDIKMCEITVGDVLKVLRPIWEEKTETASRIRGRLQHIFAYAQIQGVMDTNPALWKGNLEYHLPPYGKVHEVTHFRAMSLHTLRAYVQHILKTRHRTDMCVLFGTLCASRLQEYVRLEKKELDLERRIWTCPASRMKEEVEHRVPLSMQALQILYAELERSRSVKYVFSKFPNRPLNKDSPRKQIQSFDPGSTPHGMRSTFRDWAATNGVEFELAEMCLAHKVGDDTVNAYRRTDRLEERRAVMQAWADEIMPRIL